MAQHDTRTQILIVGGGIAGLTLALMCEKLDMSYILLEGRNSIDAKEGAGIALQPNGLRILDQLDLIEEIEAATVPLGPWFEYDGEGQLMFTNDVMSTFRDRVGYSISFFRRETLLSFLFDHISRKDCIKRLTFATSFEENDEGVVVHTRDGASYHAELLVGADGIHSRVRSFIDSWQARNKQVHRQADDYLSVSFSCCYGVSVPTKGIAPASRFVIHREDVSLLGFVGKDEVVFWFVVEKHDTMMPISQAQRYTDADADALCQAVAHIRVAPLATFGDVYANRTHKIKVDLEEGTAPVWHTNRTVLIGDAACKVSPITGMGANQAIEGTAVLINQLMKAQNKSDIAKGFTFQALRLALERYSDIRVPRSKYVLGMAHLFTLSVLCVPGKPTEMVEKMRFMSEDQLFVQQLRGWIDAPGLENLPMTA